MDEAQVRKTKLALRRQLREALDQREVFRGHPTERLAARIAERLIAEERQSPWTLCHLLQEIDVLRRRLSSAKV
jgi:transposase